MTTPNPDPVAFLLGAPRSGTTLLRVMLAGHPRIFAPPEMLLAPFETMAERSAHVEKRYWEKGGLRRALMELDGLDVEAAKRAVSGLENRSVPFVYAHLQAKLGGRMLVDKCPHLCALPEALERLDRWFPEARYIWLVRNPGSVIRSIENMPMAEVMLQGYGADPRRIWTDGNKRLQSFLEEIPHERWVRVTYEEIVESPERPLGEICETLGVEFDPAVLDPYEGDRMREGPKGARAIGDPNMAGRGKLDRKLVDKWLASFDHRTVDAETKELARRAGYDLEAIPLPAVTKVSEAIDALFDTAKELERTINPPADIDSVEGRRFLLRMLSASVDTFVEFDDADRPCFEHAESWHRKMFADCPDADYNRAPLRLGDGRVYRISGEVPEGTTYMGVLLYGKGGRVGKRLPLEKPGPFELRIAGPEVEAQGADRLTGDPDTRSVIVRQYFTDRTSQPAAKLSIELEGHDAPPPVLEAASMQKALQRSERMLRSIFERTAAAHELVSGSALKRFVPIGGDELFPTPDNAYQVCWYRFGYNQLMLVRGTIPQARYFSFTLYNAWLESLDYRHRPVHLNHTQIETDADGNFELCLSHRDLGHPNRLDVAGHDAGYLVARSLLPEGEAPRFETETIYEEEYLAR